MKIVKNPIGKAIGLMFASRNKIRKGMCLMNRKESRAGITMLFCFYPMDVIFVDSNNVVVDKVVLKPWILSYAPKKPYKYVIESATDSFKHINSGDKISINR